MATFLALFILFLSILFLLARRKCHRKEPHRHPPALPLIGNLQQFLGSNLHINLTKLSKIYGPIIYMKLFKVPVVVISSANVAKEVFKNHDIAFSSRPSTIALKKLSYNNLDIVCSPYGPYWREMRKMAVLRLFTGKQIRSFRPVREDEVGRMMSQISKRADGNQIINLSEISVSFTSNLICRVAFGKDAEESGFGDTTFRELLNEFLSIIAGIFVADHFPSLAWIDRLSGMSRRLDKIFKDMDSFYQQLVQEHLSANRPKSMDGDLIDLLIQLREEQQGSSTAISWDNIKAVVMNIFSGGTETTAVSLPWAMTALMKKPSAMKRAQEEIRSLVGKKGRVDEDDISELRYLKAVVKETMRLYPPVPLLLPRETTQKCTVHGYEIQPKTVVHVNVWAIGRDPEHWENPDQFLPQRFLDSEIDFNGQDFGLLPFGVGRRICPGLPLATAALELALANLLYSFDWGLPDGMNGDHIDTESLLDITMRKKNDLCLVANTYVV